MRHSPANPFAYILALTALVLAIYAWPFADSSTKAGCDLVSDDVAIDGRSGIAAIFSGCEVASEDGKAVSRYRPVVRAALLADSGLWGEAPAGRRITNILIQLAASLLVFLLINILGRDNLVSFVTSALFAAHPLSAWFAWSVFGKADLLPVIFTVLSVLGYAKYARRHSAAMWLLTVLAYPLSVLSGGQIITVPALFAAHDISYRMKAKIGIWAPVIFAALACSSLRTWLVSRLPPGIDFAGGLSPLERLPGFLVSIPDCARSLLWPHAGLIAYQQKPLGEALVSIVSGAAILAVLSFAVLKMRARRPEAAFAVLWFLVTLVPASGIYLSAAYAEGRWLYLPSIGFFLAAAFCIRSLYNAKHLRAAAVLLAAALIGSYSFAAVKEVDVMRNSVGALIEAGLAPGDMKALGGIAAAYEKSGLHDEAAGIYRRLSRHMPGNPELYVNLAAIEIERGNPASAITLCEKAITLKPDIAEAYNNMAVAYYMQGKSGLAKHHLDLAVKYGYKVSPELAEILNEHRE